VGGVGNGLYFLDIGNSLLDIGYSATSGWILDILLRRVGYWIFLVGYWIFCYVGLDIEEINYGNISNADATEYPISNKEFPISNKELHKILTTWIKAKR